MTPSTQAVLPPRPGWVYVRRADDGAGGPHWSRPTRQHYIVLSPQGTLEYYDSEPSSSRPTGVLSLVRAQITPLGSSSTGGTSALQIKLSEGHVVHVEASDDVERDRWCFELNLAGLRAASSDLQTIASSTPASRGPSPARASRGQSPLRAYEPPPLYSPPPRHQQQQQQQPYSRTSAEDEAVSAAAVREAAARYRTGSDGLRAAAALSHAEDSQPQQQQPPYEAQRDERIAVRAERKVALKDDPDEGEPAQQQQLPSPARLPPPTPKPLVERRPSPGSPANRPSLIPTPPPLSVRSPSGGVGPRPSSQRPTSALSTSSAAPLAEGGSSVKRTNWSAIASFIDGASIFAVSYMWSDLIASFAFSLHAIPFCGGFLDDPCTDEAPAAAQFLYALACVPVAALVKHLSETRFRTVPGASMVPTMMGYFVGWAVGNAFLQSLREIASENPALCSAELGCTALNALFSLGVTVASAFLIIFLQPYSQDVDCGEGECVDWFEDWLEDIWQLVIRGASATSMVLWYHTAFQFATAGTDGASEFAKTNLLACFTLVTFFVGSLLSHRLEQVETYLRGMQKLHPAAWRGAVIRFSDVLQDLLGFVAGCLTTDVITKLFSSLNEGPTPAIFATNVAITIFWTLAATFYLSRTGNVTIDTAADRDSVEAFFIVNSMAFFVGWMWLVVARDLVTMVGLVLRLLLTPFGVSTAQDHVTQLAAVLLSCPFLTLGVGWLSLVMGDLAGDVGPTARAEQQKLEMAEERRQRHAEVAAAKAYLSSSASSGYSRGIVGWSKKFSSVGLSRPIVRPVSAQLH